MDCTGEARRKQICVDYNVKAIGCIVLYGGRQIKSDAGGKVITDKYYKFHCVHKVSGRQEFIQCGYPTAKHICKLSGIELPAEFNPFAGDGGDGGEGGAGGVTARPKNRGRKQLYTAIMLLITAKDSAIKPNTTIFKVKESVEEDMYSDVKSSDVQSVNTILRGFKTTLPDIIAELEKHGAVREYNFDILIDIIDKKGIADNNYK